MASSVLVDTSEANEIDAEPIDVVAEDSSVVTIDTIQSDLDKLIEETPPKARDVPKKRPTLPPPPPPPTPEPTAKKHTPAKKKDDDKMFDGKSAFQEALRGTVAQSDSAELQVPALAEEKEEEEEEESSSSDEGTEPGESSSVDEEEEEEEKPVKKDVVDEEDEDKAKIRLLEESASLMSDGFMPIQQPTYSMNITILKKIVEQQEEQAAEAFGISLIGFGWIEIIRLLEIVNKRFDPAAKIMGPGKGLKLDGATSTVAENIRRYRGPFRHIWKKLQTKKLEEYSPFITMGLVTFDILKNVHMHNVRAEMHKAAAEAIKTPVKPANMEMYGVSLPHREPAKVPGEQTPPAPTIAQQPTLVQVTEEQQPQMIPVDSIVIPESDTEPADDDDVVVKVPSATAGSKRRQRKKN